MLRSWDVVVFFLFLGQIFWKIKEFHTLSILPTKVRDHITLYIRNIIIHHFIHFVLLNYLFLLLLTNNIFLKLIRNSLSWIFFQFLAKMWFSFVFLYFFFYRSRRNYRLLIWLQFGFFTLSRRSNVCRGNKHARKCLDLGRVISKGVGDCHLANMRIGVLHGPQNLFPSYDAPNIRATMDDK